MRFQPKPEWIKVRPPAGPTFNKISNMLRQRNLHTVCEEARCPNIAECWSGGTATLMLLGDVCTRGCRFCAVTSGNPKGVLDANEPQRVADALAQLDLAYVVLTMVDRDDIADGGSGHVAETVQLIRQRCPRTLIETLVSDFSGNEAQIATVVRDGRCAWERSLSVLRHARVSGANVTKSSLMVGCGETEAEVLEAMQQLRAA